MLQIYIDVLKQYGDFKTISKKRILAFLSFISICRPNICFN